MTIELMFACLISYWLIGALLHRYLRRKHQKTYYLFYGIGLLSLIPNFLFPPQFLATIPQQLKIFYGIVMCMPFIKRIWFPFIKSSFEKAEKMGVISSSIIHFSFVPFTEFFNVVGDLYDRFLCFLESLLRLNR